MLVDDCRLTAEAVTALQDFAELAVEVYTDIPSSNEEIIQRIGDADAVLVSWRTRMDAEVLQACPLLRYIGMCCSLYDESSANVAIAEAGKMGITVKGVRDYGDEGTVEYIFAQLISLCKGLGSCQWKNERVELTGKSLGIIGLGTLGKMVAATAQQFGMKVYYHSKTRKETLEQDNLVYLPVKQLVQFCDIITIHVPKNNLVITKEDFEVKKPGSILVNTSLGTTFDADACCAWIERDPGAYAIFDGDGAGIQYERFSKMSRVLLTNYSAGFTTEARERLSAKVIANIRLFLLPES